MGEILEDFSPDPFTGGIFTKISFLVQIDDTVQKMRSLFEYHQINGHTVGVKAEFKWRDYPVTHQNREYEQFY